MKEVGRKGASRGTRQGGTKLDGSGRQAARAEPSRAEQRVAVRARLFPPLPFQSRKGEVVQGGDRWFGGLNLPWEGEGDQAARSGGATGAARARGEARRRWRWEGGGRAATSLLEQ